MKLICRMMCYFLLVMGTTLATVAAMAAEGPTMTDVQIFIGPEELYSESQVWNVWCDDALQCTLGGAAVSANELFQLMPVATWGYCAGLFCYGTKQQSDILGLNPLYFTP